MKNIQTITSCAFLYKNSKVFVAKRADTKSFLPGVYELPGGHIEFGETIEAGLQRELLEEFHIDIVIGNPFYVFTYLSDNNTIHTVEIDYFATMKNPSQEIRSNPEDHSEWRWITKDEIDIYFKPDDTARTILQKGFSMLHSTKFQRSVVML